MESKNPWADLVKILSGPRLAFLALAAAGGYFLWTEHQAHLLAALPYLILLICPLMHLFMHHGHGDRQGGPDSQGHGHH